MNDPNVCTNCNSRNTNKLDKEYECYDCGRLYTISGYKTVEDGTSGWTWDNVGERAQKVKLPLGRIACPHCGSVASGVIETTCGFCNRNYFEYKQKGTV